MNTLTSIYVKNPNEIVNFLKTSLEKTEKIIYFNFYELPNNTFHFAVLEGADDLFQKPLYFKDYYLKNTDNYENHFCGAYASKIINDFSRDISKFERFKPYFSHRDYYFIDWELVGKLFESKSEILLMHSYPGYKFSIYHTIINNDNTSNYGEISFPVPEINSKFPEIFINKYYDIIEHHKLRIKLLNEELYYLEDRICDDLKLIREIDN